MPRIEMSQVATTRDVIAIRAVCDGCDAARPCDEHASSAWLWTVTSGAFELRDARGRHVMDPTRALIIPAGHEFVVRHPAGADTCVSFRGPLVDELARARGCEIVPIAPAWSARLAIELAAATSDDEPRGDYQPADRAGSADELALGEHLALLADSGESTTPLVQRRPRNDGHGPRADRDLVAAIEHVLRLDVTSSTSLGDIADRAGYSLFHACRVFRATTGQTIHGFRRELRLRHALVRILDGDEPLAEIADACGFASQSHLTNLFRARYGVTPAKARTRDGQRRLCA